MAPARLDTSALARSLTRLKVGLVGDKPLAVGGAVTDTLVDQVLEEGHVVLDALKQKDAVDNAAALARGTGEDHGKLVERCQLQLLWKGLQRKKVERG